MQRIARSILGNAVLAVVITSAGYPQKAQRPVIASSPASVALTNVADSLPPLKDPATIDQVREYLRLSGDLNSFRARWIAAVDENRSIGEPYWPESFWTAVKDEMRKTDLIPMYVELYQHSISKELMQEVLEAFHKLGAEHFRGSPECYKLGDAELKMTPDMDKIKLAKTQEVILKIYAIYKPQIKAARARYIAEHPGSVDK